MDETAEGRWLSYAEAGKVLGVTPQAVRMLVRRHGWARRIPNAYGERALVLVPDEVIARHRAASDGVRMGSAPAREQPPANGHEHPEPDRRERLFERALEALTEQLTLANKRADRAEQERDQERARADQAERRLADKDATITGLVAEKQVLKQEVETLTELARARRSWWRRAFGR
jgi:hypothetical protein